jgi:predicted patatin/cPLA2 family phospholipase
MLRPDPAFRKPLGLVLAGGGALGSWQIAFLAELVERGLVFDSVLGFSAGALNGAAYFVGRLDDTVKRWSETKASVMKFRPKLFPVSLFSDQTIWEAIDYVPEDREAKARARCRFVMVNAHRDLSGFVYPQYAPDGGGWDEPFKKHLVASCSIPWVFPPVKIAFRGQERFFVDGGMACAEPMSFREIGPCRDVIVLEMVRNDEMGRKVHGPFKRWDQRSREAVRNLMDQGTASLLSMPDPPRVFRIAPSKILDFNQLVFDNRRIRDAMSLGRSDARAFMEKPEVYDESGKIQA